MTTLADIRDLPSFSYLGTPYSLYPFGLKAAAEDAAVLAGALMQRGHKIFSPIVHSHAICEVEELGNDYHYWVEADRPFVEAASALIVAKFDGWEDSLGLAHEIAEFRKAGKPIVFLEQGEIDDAKD